MLHIQKFMIIAVLTSIAVFTGCVGEGSDSRLGASPDLDVQNSTIERFTPNSDVVELYTPGAQEIIRYNQTSNQISSVPADPELVEQFNQIISNVTGPNLVPVSCSSRDGTQDCFCSSGCCRTQTQCNCC